MAQTIKQADIFGRIGSGIGQGLASQLPEEIQRGRLASGLQSFEQNHQNLSPIQQLARLSSIPGITPQMIQSFSELAKIQNQRNAYGNKRSIQNTSPEQDISSSPNLSEVNQANQLDQAANTGLPMQKQFNPTTKIDITENKKTPSKQEGISNANPSQYGQPQLANYNPGDPRAISRLPWTPQQRDDRVLDYINRGFLPDQARDLASDDETRDLAIPGTIQKQQAEKKTRAKEAEEKLTDYVQTRLQKSGEGIYQDITGDMLADLKRAMSKAIIENPNASADDIADDFSRKALRMAKVKKEVQGLGEKTGWESIGSGDKVLNKLNSYQKVFEDAGNQEEYYNILRSDFGLSPQGAATIAFPLQKQIKKYVDSYKPSYLEFSNKGPFPTVEKMDNNARKAAIDVEKFIDEDDSVLSIARNLAQQDPFFNERVFFEQLTNNPKSKLNPRQRAELGSGERDFLPSWGDIKIFPWYKRSKK